MRLFYVIIFSLFIVPSLVLADPVHSLIPFTSTKDLEPCSKYLDNESISFYKTTRCASNVMDLPKTLSLPNCYIITTKSPDVHEGKDTNFISIFMLGLPAIMGFYEEKTTTIYIVENSLSIIAEIYNHEVGHYLIHLTYGMMWLNGDPEHSHEFWTECSSPTYNPESRQ